MSVLIAIVEDDPSIRNLLTETLEDAGYSVAAAETGERAIKMLEKRASEFRALVTDVRLGRGVSGWEVAHRARELNPGIPIVYMSGDSGVDWAAEGVPKSIMMTKPFAMGQVLSALAQLLNERG